MEKEKEDETQKNDRVRPLSKRRTTSDDLALNFMSFKKNQKNSTASEITTIANTGENVITIDSNNTKTQGTVVEEKLSEKESEDRFEKSAPPKKRKKQQEMHKSISTENIIEKDGQSEKTSVEVVKKGKKNSETQKKLKRQEKKLKQQNQILLKLKRVQQINLI